MPRKRLCAPKRLKNNPTLSFNTSPTPCTGVKHRGRSSVKDSGGLFWCISVLLSVSSKTQWRKKKDLCRKDLCVCVCR